MQKNLESYHKLKKEEPFWCRIVYWVLFPILLFLVSIISVNHGVDVSDTMYSLSSNALFSEAKGDWNLFMAYYLANFVGFLFMKLPFGHTMLGMNFYTSMVIYATAMIVYFSLGKRKKISYPLLFVGEIIAISFCWCPSTVLYNFLSYLLWTIGILQLKNALFSEEGRRRSLAYVGAGAILGASVFVKFPNITIAIMILLVFYKAFLTKEKAVVLWKKVGFCVLGFVGAFAILFLIIEIAYGRGTYLSMVQSLFAMTDTATDYQSGNMLGEILDYYLKVLPFAIGMVVATTAGIIMLHLAKKLDGKRDSILLMRSAKILYIICIPVLIRLFYGRGLFGIDYTTSFAIIFIGVLFLWIALGASFGVMIKKDMSIEMKCDAAILILLIFITPLGSNNGAYPVLDNLFLILPLGSYFVIQLVKEKQVEIKFPVYAMLIAFLTLMVVQGLRFTGEYSFKGQDQGKTWDAKIENNDILKGMMTNKERAQELEETLDKASTLLDESSNRYLFTYGNIPGFFFLLKDSMPIVSTTWPDLDSFSYETYQSNLMGTKEKIIEKEMEQPLLILTVDAYTHMNGTEATKKEVLLKEFMETLEYDMMFENERYLIFR